MRRLFNAAWSQLVYAKMSTGEAIRESSSDGRPDRVLVERAQARCAGALWESKIYLGEAFFNEIIRHPVPLDMNTLTALKRCSLGLDLYLWLVVPHLHASCSATQLSWRAGVPSVRPESKQRGQRHELPSKTSAASVLRELKKIKLAWPELNYTTAPGVLVLHPSTPTIPPAPEPLRLAG